MRRPRILLAEHRFSDAARSVLAQKGEVIDFTTLEEFNTRLPETDAIVTGLEVHLRGPLLDRAKRLQVIGSRTSQLRHIDLEECQRRGIEVLFIDPEAPLLQETASTAEETMALILTLARNIPWAFDAIKEGRWERAKFGGHELKGKTLGLIGFGRLGRMVSSYAQAFGMQMLVSDPGKPPELFVEHGVELVALDVLLQRSDFVSLHCTFSEETRGMLRNEHFQLMAPGTFFINTARGEITDEEALLAALESGHLAGAAIDTLAGEHPDGSHLINNPLVEYARTHDNLVILPHLGGATVEATERTQLYIAEQVAQHFGP